MVDARPGNVFVVLRRVRNSRTIIIIIIIIIAACTACTAADRGVRWRLTEPRRWTAGDVAGTGWKETLRTALGDRLQSAR